MRLYPQSLKNALLITVCLTIAAGCILVGFLASQRYAASLEKALTVQGESLSKGMAAQLADFVLINDITTIQKYLDRQKQHQGLEYAFITQDGTVLAHTFEQGIPGELVNFNLPPDGMTCVQRPLTFKHKGGVYLDVACPIFEGAGGTVRVGISENTVRTQVAQLWLETALVTGGVMLLAIVGIITLLRNLTRPLEALTTALGQVGRDGEGPSPVPCVETLPSQAEVATLTRAFNRMSQRLEAETREVARSHEQLRMCHEIVENLASRRTLEEVALYLLDRCRHILHCGDLSLILGGAQQKCFWVVSSGGMACIQEWEHVHAAQELMNHNGAWCDAGSDAGAEDDATRLKPPLVPARFAAAVGQVRFALMYNEYCCGMLVALCTSDCHCDKGEVNVLRLVLTQAAGSVYRAMLNEEERLQWQHKQDGGEDFHGIVGKDAAMRLLFQRLEQVAPSDATVLLQSESGTGKELVAHALHDLSPRAGQPFIVINCAAYPDTLLESELFGHEKGAFTGADRQKQGRFEQAHGGTVFLDEIGEISHGAQVKLLRVLQSRTFERVGGSESIQVNVRIVAATSRDLQEEVRLGRFREDLYYRLDVIPLSLPPLRERRGDIPVLARHFLARFSERMGRPLPSLSPRALRLLMDYSWPGNVRELENVLEQAFVLSQGENLDVDSLPERLQARSASSFTSDRESFERECVMQALQRAQGNKKEAAAQLGISRTTLYAKLKRFGIAVDKESM